MLPHQAGDQVKKKSRSNLRDSYELKQTDIIQLLFLQLLQCLLQ